MPNRYQGADPPTEEAHGRLKETWVLTPLVLLCVSDLEECEPGWEKFQGFCYQHFTKRQSWEAAEQHCRMCGGHLISLMTPEEQDYINGKV